MGKRVRVPISTARAKLFQLTDLVRTSGDDTVVVFEQRGGLEQVALVRETRLAYLEARVTELDKRDAKPFSLAGSLTSDLGRWRPGASVARHPEGMDASLHAGTRLP